MITVDFKDLFKYNEFLLLCVHILVLISWTKYLILFIFNKFTYLFIIFGCVGSSLLHGGFL